MTREVLEALYHGHYDPLCAVAGRYVPSADDAEDVVQEVFTRFCERREIWERCRAPERYLYVAVRNRALKHRRHSRVVREAHRLIECLRRPVGTSQRVALPDEEVQAAELAGAFRSSVDRLPKRSREAYLAHYWKGMSHARVAQQMGTSARTVETQIGQAKKMLGRELAPCM